MDEKNAAKEIQKSRTDKIIRLHKEIVGHFLKVTFPKAVEIGKLLTQRKKDIEYGHWLNWVNKTLPFDARTVERYLLVYKNREYLQSRIDTMSNVGIAGLCTFIRNKRIFDDFSKEYGLSKSKRIEAERTLTPTMTDSDIESVVSRYTPPLKKRQGKMDEEWKKREIHTKNRLAEIRRGLTNVTVKISELSDGLESAKLNQVGGFEISDLDKSVERFNTTYKGLRQFFVGIDEAEPAPKKVESTEVIFPRKELAAAIQSH